MSRTLEDGQDLERWAFGTGAGGHGCRCKAQGQKCHERAGWTEMDSTLSHCVRGTCVLWTNEFSPSAERPPFWERPGEERWLLHVP